ncbi:MAG: polyprenyl synthetase family protein [Polyangiaceae bacterium]
MSLHGAGVGESAAFQAFARATKATVDADLTAWLSGRASDARRHAEDAGVVADAVLALSTRGGKRVRAVLLAAAFEACRDREPVKGESSPVAMALVAIELLQTYLLIHDDWMDDDDVRRGGPSVHAMLREKFGSSRAGDVAGVLAGDYAAALALEALSETPVEAARVTDAVREFARIQTSVIIGQLIDVRAGAKGALAVEAMHDLKTGSYTVRGPVAIGAILAGASPDVRAALDAFARPLGVAFQLRDDLLGTFGDPSHTGKPHGSDIRQGKRTALIAELETTPLAEPLLARAHGVADASAGDIETLVAFMVSSGAKARVEARLAALSKQAETELARSGLAASRLLVLKGAIAALGEREK